MPNKEAELVDDRLLSGGDGRSRAFLHYWHIGRQGNADQTRERYKWLLKVFDKEPRRLTSVHALGAPWGRDAVGHLRWFPCHRQKNNPEWVLWNWVPGGQLQADLPSEGPFQSRDPRFSPAATWFSRQMAYRGSWVTAPNTLSTGLSPLTQ